MTLLTLIPPGIPAALLCGGWYAPAPRDAFVVLRLREAGAANLGQTNLSKCANIRSGIDDVLALNRLDAIVAPTARL
jgi:hypothetical protein